MSLAAWSWQRAGQLLVEPPHQAAPICLSTPSGPSELQELADTLAGLHGEPTADPTRFLGPGLRFLELDPDPDEREQLRGLADDLRRRLVGDTVTYVVNRNLNVSNHCSKHCGFCAFRRDPGEEGAYWLDRDELRQRAAEARAAGATELCVQGGLNPAARLGGSFTAYAEQLLRDLHDAAPGIHLHAFSPQELLFFAEGDGLPLVELIHRLRASGLGSVPGTAAEVLSERVRRRVCPEKLSARAWCAVILEVHASGLASTATLMAGHLEAPADRLAHLLTLLALQRDAFERHQPGFSEFVLLPFVGQAAPAPLRQRVGRDQPDLQSMLTLTAQARLLLGPDWLNHQPSWVKLTLAGATEALRWGCNDLGGTLMEEHITTMAGARGGTSQTPEALEAAARSLGRSVQQRLTLYGTAP
ncbi:MAG: CofH family radical SAM protein [Cyanobacteriota bacterium]|nr:CofH family radical SAM protein [Cyanobacteriota bacterium]